MRSLMLMFALATTSAHAELETKVDRFDGTISVQTTGGYGGAYGEPRIGAGMAREGGRDYGWIAIRVTNDSWEYLECHHTKLPNGSSLRSRAVDRGCLGSWSSSVDSPSTAPDSSSGSSWPALHASCAIVSGSLPVGLRFTGGAPSPRISHAMLHCQYSAMRPMFSALGDLDFPTSRAFTACLDMPIGPPNAGWLTLLRERRYLMRPPRVLRSSMSTIVDRVRSNVVDRKSIALDRVPSTMVDLWSWTLD